MFKNSDRRCVDVALLLAITFGLLSLTFAYLGEVRLATITVVPAVVADRLFADLLASTAVPWRWDPPPKPCVETEAVISEEMAAFSVRETMCITVVGSGA